MIVRPARLKDVPAIAEIYHHHVIHGFGTFEEAPPSVEDMTARLRVVQDKDMPWFVVEEDRAIVAWAYAAQYRDRSAYRFTVEDSVYVAPEMRGKGYGRAALEAVIKACEAKGMRRVIAVIGDSRNEASIGLHHALGFIPCGLLPSVGFKGGRWLDVMLMQLPLNGGDETKPVSAAGFKKRWQADVGE